MTIVNQITSFKISGFNFIGTDTQLNYTAGVTAGIGSPSKALVLNAASSITSGITSLRMNSLITNTLTVNGTSVSSSSITNLNFIDGITLGVGAANKVLSLDSSRNVNNINTLSATNLAGTLSTSAQPNITSLGTLNSLVSNGNVNIAQHNGSTIGLQLNSILVTASANELNILKGATISTSELNRLTGLTSSTSELNRLTGLTSSTSELNILTGVTANSTQLNYLSGTTPGSATATKVLIVDSNRDITNIRNLTVTTNLTSTNGRLWLNNTEYGISHRNTTGGTSEIVTYSNGINTNWIGTFTNNSFGLATNNILRLNILNDGKIGINTTSPTRQLDINASDGNCLRLIFNNSGTTFFDQTISSTGGVTLTAAGTAPLINLSGGVVTITNTTDSTNSTNGSLVVSGGLGISTSLNVGNSITTNTRAIINNSSSSVITNTSLTSTYGLILRNNIQSNGQYQTTSIGFLNSGSDLSPGASIIFNRTGGNSVGDLVFSTKSAGSVNTCDERVRILSSGELRLVNSTNFVDLSVNSNSDLYIKSNSNSVYIGNTSANSQILCIGPDLSTGNNGSLTFLYNGGIQYIQAGQNRSTNSSVDLFIGDVARTTITSNRKIMFKSNGRVGFGTNAPDRALEINDTSGNCLRLTNNDSDGTAANFADFIVSESGNLTITPSGGSVNISTHNGTNAGLQLGGVLLTASANELNLMKGVTSTTAELNYVDLSTGPGTGEANKAIVLNISRDISNINNITTTGTLSNTFLNNTTTLTNYQTWTNNISPNMITALQMSNLTSAFGTTSSHSLRFITNNTNRMTISSSGNIGINTTSPSRSLDNLGTFITGGTTENITSWGTGVGFLVNHTTLNDTLTPSSGIITQAAMNGFFRPTITATNTNVTVTNAATMYIDNPPLAGTNISITNAYALWINSGRVLIDDTTTSNSSTSGALVISGGVGISGALNVNGGIFGTLSTSSQPNITNIGTLTGLTSSGIISITNTTTSSNSTNGALIVSGGVGISGSLNINNNITSNGTITSNASTGFSHNNSGVSLVSTILSNVNYLGTSTNHPLALMANNTERIRILANGNVGINTNNPTNTLDVSGTLRTTGIVSFTNTTDSVSATTGALVLSGGLGVNDTADAVNNTNGGALTVAGGVAISKKLFIGTNITIGNTTDATSSLIINANTGAGNGEGSNHGLIITGGLISNPCLYMGADNTNNISYIQSSRTGTTLPLVLNNRGGNVGINTTSPASTLDVNGTLRARGVVTITNTTVSTSTSTGALQITGGLTTRNIWLSPGSQTLPSWSSSNAPILNIQSGIFTDSSTASNTTNFLPTTFNIFRSNTLFSSNSNVTTAQISNVSIADTFPSTNMNISNRLALFTEGAIQIGSVSKNLISGFQTLYFKTTDSTFTDIYTPSNSTNFTTWGLHSFASCTFAATNSNVTYNSVANVLIQDAPISGTNATLTNSFALLIQKGRTRLLDTTISTSSTTGALTVSGGVGIGGALNVNATATMNELQIGNSSHNMLRFFGTTNDAGGYHTVLSERIYADTEKSELLIFKGNDAGGAAGPDRIRLRSAEIVFQTYDTGEIYNPSGSPPVSDNNTRLTISNNGNVNIINHNETSTGLHLNSVLVTTSAAELNILDGVTASTAQLNFLSGVAAGTAAGDKALVLNTARNIANINDITATGVIRINRDIDGFRHDSDGTNSGNTVSVRTIVSHTDKWGAIGTTISGRNHPFSLCAGGNDRKLTILTNGNVGIATTSPTSTLDVNGQGNFRSSPINTLILTSTGTDTAIEFNSSSSRKWWTGVAGTGSSLAAGTFFIYDNNALTSRLVIDTSGNVGIGNISPSQRLHISGTTRTNSLVVGSNNVTSSTTIDGIIVGSTTFGGSGTNEFVDITISFTSPSGNAPKSAMAIWRRTETFPDTFYVYLMSKSVSSVVFRIIRLDTPKTWGSGQAIDYQIYF